MVAEAFAWWLTLEAAGLIALPIAFVLFGRLPGRGYAFSKPLGLLLGGYVFWLALSLHLLPNRPGSVVWAFLLLALVDAVILRRRWRQLSDALIERAGFILAVEVLFLLAFGVAVFLRSFLPEIGGTEKPMDFMFLTTSARSHYYPPSDAWLSGSGVSYYYFGYLIQAMVTKIAAVPLAVGFNLALAGTAATAVTAAFGLGYEAVRAARRVTLTTGITVGVAAVLLVAVIGNLEGVLEFGVANNGALPAGVVDRVDINSLPEAKPSSACLVGIAGHCIEYPDEQSSFWWWWRATRISPDGNSITEFPFFSFLLGDLHPHVMAIPYVLTIVGFGLSLWRSEDRLSADTWRRSPALLLGSGVLLGGLGFLNTWDLPTFGFVLVLIALARDLSGGRGLRPAIDDALGFLLPLFGLALLLYVPFYISFSSQASGLDAVRNGATRPLHSFLFWAPLLAVSLPLPLLALLRDRQARTVRRVLRAAALPAGLILLWLLVVIVEHGFSAAGGAIGDRGWNWLTALVFASALTVCLLAVWRALESEHASEDSDDAMLIPILIMMVTAMLLIFGSELFYIKDVFGSRLNTVFKLSYQAWLLLGVSGAYGIYRLFLRTPDRAEAAPLAIRSETWRGVWSATLALVLGGALLYPIGATLSRTDGLSGGRTLDGLIQARRDNPDDYAAIVWLDQHADRGERIVEGTGGEYSSSGRVSEATGIPTVIGWAGHELQWGRDGGAVGKRGSDVDQAYSTGSLAEAVAILRKYGVTYVFVGAVERAKYPPAGLQKFADGLSQAFRAGQATVYRLPPPDASGRDVPGVVGQ